MAAANCTWHQDPPAVEECLASRPAAGLGAFPVTAADAGKTGNWPAACVRHAGRLVGLGRVVGDGGCCLGVDEVTVDPACQRRGPGSVVMQRLADPPGVRLCASFGFRANAPASVGMFRRFAQVPGEHP